MSALQLAEARHRTYALVGRLVLSGLDADSREIVAALPELDAAVEGGPDDWAVAHQRVWGFEIFPYESAFLTEDGLLGGSVSSAVSEAYGRAGVRFGRTDTEPDHLGAELLHMAHLCAAERDALADGQAQAAEQVVELQRAFLSAHLLSWLPAVLVAVEGRGTAFDRALVALIAELVGDHATALGAAPEATNEGAPVDAEALLADRKTGIKRISEVLLRPSASGWFLSAGAIGSLAAKAGVPEGFGPRVKKLESVVFAAVDHDAFPPLLDALDAERAAWLAHYDRLTAAGLDGTAWKLRLEGTAGLLAGLRQAL